MAHSRIPSRLPQAFGGALLVLLLTSAACYLLRFAPLVGRRVRQRHAARRQAARLGTRIIDVTPLVLAPADRRGGPRPRRGPLYVRPLPLVRRSSSRRSRLGGFAIGVIGLIIAGSMLGHGIGPTSRTDADAPSIATVSRSSDREQLVAEFTADSGPSVWAQRPPATSLGQGGWRPGAGISVVRDLSPTGSTSVSSEDVAGFFPDEEAALDAMARAGRVGGTRTEYRLQSAAMDGVVAVSMTVAEYRSAAAAAAVFSDPTVVPVLHRFGVAATEVDLERGDQRLRAFRGVGSDDGAGRITYVVQFQRDHTVGSVVVTLHADADDGGGLALGIAEQSTALRAGGPGLEGLRDAGHWAAPAPGSRP